MPKSASTVQTAIQFRLAGLQKGGIRFTVRGNDEKIIGHLELRDGSITWTDKRDGKKERKLSWEGFADRMLRDLRG